MQLYPRTLAFKSLQQSCNGDGDDVDYPAQWFQDPTLYAFYREIARAFSMTPSAVVNFRSGNNIMKGSCFLSASLVPPVSRSLALALEPSHIHYPRCKRKRTVKMVAAIPPPPRLARLDTGCCPSPTIQRVGCNLLLFRHRECGTKVSSYDVVPKICSGFGTPCLRAS